MFLPILNYADGYGFTYGGAFSTVDLLGAGERLSVPLTWGGTRRAALELERTFKRGPLTPRRVELRHLAAREPALRDRRSARRVDGRAERSFAGSSAPASTRRRARWTSAARRSALDGRRRRRARHARRPGIPAQRRVSSAPAGTGCTSAASRPDQPLHDRRARLPRRHRPGGARRPRAVLHRRRAAPRYERLLLGGASTLRGFGPARSTAIACRHVRGAAGADHVGAERRELGVTASSTRARSSMSGSARRTPTGTRRRRRRVPDRAARPHQSRRRARPEGRRHAGPLGSGFRSEARVSSPGSGSSSSSGRQLESWLRARADSC